MINLIALKATEIGIGPVPRDIYNSKGSLLIKRGSLIESNHQINSLLARGAFYLKKNHSKTAKPRTLDNVFSAETTPENPITLLENIASQLVLLFAHDTGKESNFTEQIMMLVDKIQLACDTNIDASLASILVLEGFSTPIKHSIDVAVLTEVMAKKSSITKKERKSMVAAALTMDISTIELQEHLNYIDSPMTREQTRRILKHPEESVRILHEANVDDELWLRCVLEHHEKKDGSGYPNHVRGERLHYPSQIISISNQYCARISPRGYREPRLHKNTLRQIFLDEGVQISNKLEKLFVKQLGLYPLGAIVRLANLEFGQVFKQGKKLTSPIVYTCYKPEIGNYHHPIKRDTAIEDYKIIEVIEPGHKEITFDKRTIWRLEEKHDISDDSAFAFDSVESKTQEDNFKDLNAKIDDLPILPVAVSQLMGLSIDDENYFDKVHRLAEQDPTFAIRLIRQANTVQNASVSQISTLDYAITRIGARQIKGLISTFAVAKIFIPLNKSESDLWVHSVQVAVTARSIVSMDSQLQIEPEQAYLCGLLHDIGRFILFRIMPDGPIRTDEKDWKNPDQLVLAEQQACGINHAELGFRACKKWNLSEDVAHAIAQHHEYTYYSTQSIPDQKLTQLTKVIQVADSFSMLLMRRPEILELSEGDLYNLLADECIHSSWDASPVDIRKLCEEAKNISDRTDEIINELNLPT